MSLPHAFKSLISSFGRQSSVDAGETRKWSILTGSMEGCSVPRAERLGALDGSSLVAALRFDGTVEVLSLLLVWLFTSEPATGFFGSASTRSSFVNTWAFVGAASPLCCFISDVWPFMLLINTALR